MNEPSAGSPPSLESVLCTDELSRRPSRPPDYGVENLALVSLAQALADSPGTTLQTLADTILEVCHCDSAGVSLVTKDGKKFHWPAIAGQWTRHIGGGTPRAFSPCGDVLDLISPLLFTHFERRYTYFKTITPLVEECLVVPFSVAGIAVGTIWAIIHAPNNESAEQRCDARNFDSEDLRRLASLANFAALAYQAVGQLDAFEAQDRERREAITALREMNEALLLSSIRQHELAERAQNAETSRAASEERLRESNALLEERVTRRTAELRQTTERLRSLSSELARAEQSERRRLASVLHDHVQQLLVAARLQIEILAEKRRSKADRKSLNDVASIVNDGIDLIRTLSVDLVPPLLHGEGLPAALDWLSLRMTEQHRLTISVHADPEANPSDEDERDFLYHAARELLLNVVKHAKTDTASVRLTREEKVIMLEVTDQGTGFEPEELNASSFGLFQLRERVHALGGTATISSERGSGTQVAIVLQTNEELKPD